MIGWSPEDRRRRFLPAAAQTPATTRCRRRRYTTRSGSGSAWGYSAPKASPSTTPSARSPSASTTTRVAGRCSPVSSSSWTAKARASSTPCHRFHSKNNSVATWAVESSIASPLVTSSKSSQR